MDVKITLMKAFAVLVFSILFFTVYSQSDTTKSNLKRFKDLHEQGLINDREYELLKQKELNLSALPKDTINLKKVRAQIIAGSLSIAACITNVGLGFYYRGKIDYIREGNSYRVITYESQSKTCFIVSSVFGACGVALIATGIHKRAKRINQLSFSPTSATILINLSN